MATPHIQNVAIVGASGRVGKHYAEALIRTGKHKVTALTREGSTGKVVPGAEIVKINYENEESIVSALKGQQFLVICLGVRAPEDVGPRIVRAAAKAGVSYIMPNIHGNDLSAPTLKDSPLSAAVSRRVTEVEETGIPWIVITTGFWYEWSLALGEYHFGIDINQKKARFCDDGKTPTNTTTWPQCGEALAALLSLPESGASPSLSDWKNKQVYVDSFCTTQREILDSVQRATGTTDKDWDIICEPAEKRYREGMEAMQKGEFMALAKALYARTFFNDGTADYESRVGLDNDKLGLKREDIDQVTKQVVEKVQNGWSPWNEW